MKIICISDTHSAHNQISIPNGDIFLHAGDWTGLGTETELIEFNDWIGTLPHQHKIIIGGNHDFALEKYPEKAKHLLSNAHYLCDSEVIIEGLKIWGSPVTPYYHNWAFNRHRGRDIQAHWDMIPKGIDILITHGPPANLLDKVKGGLNVGCVDLLNTIRNVKPKIHLFGHIHEDYGMITSSETLFINASVMNVNFNPINAPIFLEY